MLEIVFILKYLCIFFTWNLVSYINLLGELTTRCKKQTTLVIFRSKQIKFWIFMQPDSTYVSCYLVSSGSWWWTGKPGMLQAMGLQRIGQDLATELAERAFNYTGSSVKRPCEVIVSFSNTYHCIFLDGRKQNLFICLWRT